MVSLKNFDVKFANFIRRCFAFYVRKRSGVNNSVPVEVDQSNIWNSLFKSGKEEYVHSLSEDLKIVLYKDSILCKCIYFGFEEEELIFLDKFLKKGDCFVDIGANVGLYSLLASKKVGNEGKILAFEPTPSTYKRLEKNILINNIDTITAYNVGLSNKEGVLDFYTSNSGFDAWNSFAKLPQLENCDKTKVNIVSLDNLKKKYYQNYSFNLVKLDVEGWEFYVLEGAKDILAKESAPVIIVEFNEVNAFSAGYYCGNVYDLLKSFGYSWYKYDNKNNLFIEQEKKLHYSCENLIAIKNLNNVINRINDHKR